MRRGGLSALLFVALDGSTALAHGGGTSSGGSGVSLRLLLVGVALLAGGFATRGKLANARASWGLVAAGGALAVASLFVGGDGGRARPDVHLSVVEPAAGSTVPAGQPVTVAVRLDGPIASGPGDTGGGHLHLSVDGALQQMPYASQTNVTLDPGDHTITVEYVDNQHLSYDPPIQHSVEVTAT